MSDQQEMAGQTQTTEEKCISFFVLINMGNLCCDSISFFSPSGLSLVGSPELGMSDAHVEESREGTISIHLG